MICAQLFPGKVGFYGPLIPFVLCISATLYFVHLSVVCVVFWFFIVIIQNMNRSAYPLSYECNQF